METTRIRANVCNGNIFAGVLQITRSVSMHVCPSLLPGTGENVNVCMCEREILDGDDYSARNIALIAQEGGRCDPDTHLIIFCASLSIRDAEKMQNIHIGRAHSIAFTVTANKIQTT